MRNLRFILNTNYTSTKRYPPKYYYQPARYMETSPDTTEIKPWKQALTAQIQEVEKILYYKSPMGKFIAKEIEVNNLPENVARREVFRKEFHENMKMNVNNKEILENLGFPKYKITAPNPNSYFASHFFENIE